MTGFGSRVLQASIFITSKLTNITLTLTQSRHHTATALHLQDSLSDKQNSRRFSRVARLILFFLCASLLSEVNAAAATYYVNNTHSSANDNNAGTSTSLPWRTIGRAASSVVA